MDNRSCSEESGDLAALFHREPVDVVHPHQVTSQADILSVPAVAELAGEVLPAAALILLVLAKAVPGPVTSAALETPEQALVPQSTPVYRPSIQQSRGQRSST